MTTDVQHCEVIITPNSVRVECTLIPGSQSKGCHVKFVRKDGSIELRNIKRTAGNCVQDELVVINEIKYIMVFDWEGDGTIGNVSAVHADIIGNVSVNADIIRTMSLPSTSGLGTMSTPSTAGLGTGTGNAVL